MTEINIIAINYPDQEIHVLEAFFLTAGLVKTINNLRNTSDVFRNIEKDALNILIIDMDTTNSSLQEFLEICSLKDVVIIITASDKKMIINNLNSVFFLLKPFHIKNLSSILESVDEQSKKNGFNFTSRNSRINGDIVTIPSLDRIDIVKISNILYCSADGKYTTFHLINGGTLVSSKNLGEYEKIFDCSFLRIHHSYIVNISYVVGLIKKNGLYCELLNSVIVPVSKRKQENFNRIFK